MEQWSSRFGFVLAAIGAAVGLGNIWRFAVVVGQNGGGAYLIPYAISFFVFAIPLMVLEIAVGRHLGGDVVSAFRSVSDRSRWIGWIVVATVVVVLSYYLVITGWTLAFLVYTLLGVSSDLATFTGGLQPLLFFAASLLATAGILSLGVRDGIERTVSVLIPLVFVILTGMLAYVATLPGFGEGVAYLLTPDFSVLSRPGLWAAAFGQAFFSLSVGQGIMLTFGSYLDRETSIVRSVAIVGVLDFAAAILAGLVIFGIVFSFGLSPDSGAVLAFTTLPAAFAAMPFGQVVAAAFFGLLFAAALTSSVALMEVAVAPVMDSTGAGRRRAVALVAGATLLIGLPSALSYTSVGLSIGGVPVLDLVDDTAGATGLLVTALLLAVAFTWRMDRSMLDTELGGAARPVAAVTKYVLPPLLVVLLAARLSTAVPGWHVLPGLATGAAARTLAPLAVAVLVLAAVYRTVQGT